MNDTDGGTSVCTPADPMGYADINFTDDGDAVILMWSGTSWAVLASNKVATDMGLVDVAN